MKLAKVIYREFSNQIVEPWTDNPISWHQLDGEVLLVSHEEERLYVSWGSAMQYCIQIKHDSFFEPDALVEIDMSRHPYWAALLDQPIAVQFMGKDNQVLVLSNGQSVVYLSSQYDDGSFLGDCVRVSKVNPL